MKRECAALRKEKTFFYVLKRSKKKIENRNESHVMYTAEKGEKKVIKLWTVRMDQTENPCGKETKLRQYGNKVEESLKCIKQQEFSYFICLKPGQDQ